MLEDTYVYYRIVRLNGVLDTNEKNILVEGGMAEELAELADIVSSLPLRQGTYLVSTKVGSS